MTPLVLPVGHVPLADGDDASTARTHAEQNVVPAEDRAETRRALRLERDADADARPFDSTE